MFTVEQVKAMGINQIIELLEKKSKRPLPEAIKIRLAMLHGAKEAGVKVFQLDQCIDYQEFLKYEELTRLLNGLEDK